MPKLKQVDKLLEEFDKAQAGNATYSFWRQYTDLVYILPQFTRSIRDEESALYLESFAEMLPWFGEYDHVNYLRWGCTFLADMKQLDQTAPEVYQGFQSGDFIVKESNQRFNQVPADLGLEHANKMGKVDGGLIGIPCSDLAHNRWELTYIERARLAGDTRVMLGIIDEDDEGSQKELGKTRKQRDEDDTAKLAAQFASFHVFSRESTQLVSLMIGDIPSGPIVQDLQNALVKDQQFVEKFVSDRLVKKTQAFIHPFQKKKVKDICLHVFARGSKTQIQAKDRELQNR